MNINNVNIELSDNDKKYLKSFFEQYEEYILRVDLANYTNIDLFTKLYEEYLKANKLLNNDILMLFLLELKCSVLSYKIANKHKNDLIFVGLNGNNIITNEVIKRWYEESKEGYTVPNIEILKLGSNVGKKLESNAKEYKKGFQNIENVIFKQRL